MKPYLFIRRSANRLNGRLGRRVEAPRTTTRPPVFVGGTGRSGTTIVARLLGMNPAYHTIATELKFHSAWQGLSELARGRTSYREYEALMVDRWQERLLRQPSKPRITAETVRAALDDLSRDLWVDHWMAGARFTSRLLDPIATATGKAGWIEQTPTNAWNAPSLARMFPDARFVTCVRDGRDTACSVVAKDWGPTTHSEGLEWWARRTARVNWGMAGLPAGQALEIHLESLIAEDRDATYRRLLEFLELDDDPRMRAFFDHAMTPESAHIGRWRTDVPAPDQEGFIAQYERLLATLVSTPAGGRPHHRSNRSQTEALP